MKHAAQTTTTKLVVIDGENMPRRDRRIKEKRLGLIGRIKMWHAKHFGNDAAVQDRRNVPIMAYVGHNGSGKTQCMFLDTLPTLEGIEWDCDQKDHEHTKAGITHGVRQVLSTAEIYDENGDPHPLYVPFDSWDRLTGFEHGDLLMDEMVTIAHSRHSSSLPPQIEALLNQFRKADITVRWTAPDWLRADKLVRETTQAVTICRGSMPVKQGTDLWKSNTRFRYLTFDARDFDEFSVGKVDKLDPLAAQWFWADGHRVRTAYDTKQSVIMLGHASDSGICVSCGGTRRRSECSCPDYQHRKELHKQKTGRGRKPVPSAGDTPTVELSIS